MFKILDQLEQGTVRAANRQLDGTWQANSEVKQAILDVFRQSPLTEFSGSYTGFVDKEALPPRQFSLTDKVRIVPGGTSVRRGAYVAPSVVIMPPSYINIGAYVDSGTMVDSHVLVGSCAQIGKNVHLSTAVQIGGVLEPIGQRPVIVEDDCFIGAGVILTEGIWVQKSAVLAPNVSLSASVPIYDLVRQEVYKGFIPAQAVVIPGTRSIAQAWAVEQGLSLNCAIIVKYRDEQTSAHVALEESLRS